MGLVVYEHECSCCTSTTCESLVSVDLSNCQLVTFPDGAFKLLRTVTENIHVITLADNKMKAISSKFFTTFTNLKGRKGLTTAYC